MSSSALLPSITGILVSLVLCAIGPSVAMRIFAKVRRTEKLIKLVWLAFAAMAAGATFWSVNLLLIISTDLPVHMGRSELYALSLGFAIVSTFLGFWISASTKRSVLIEVGGAVTGLAVFGTLLLSIYSISPTLLAKVPSGSLTASLVLACAFGALATNRIARPVSRFCKYGGGASLIVTIVLCYLCIVMGLSAHTFESVNAPQMVQMAGVVSVAALLIFAAAAAYFIDLRHLRETNVQVQAVALKDPLTGLINQQGFEQRLTTTVTQLLDDTASIAVVVIEISQVKEINGAHGLAAGDAVLHTVAERLTQSLGADEYLGKFTGNRFLAVKYPIYHKSEARKFCDKIRADVEKPIDWNSNKLSVGCSAGIALFPSHGVQSTQLIEHADLAVLRAKEMPDQPITIYNPQIDDQKRSKHLLSIDLRRAVHNGELELHYQRQNRVDTQELVGFETLMRWKHPEQGLISPGIFIPIAEESQLIVELGTWALREACKEAATWDKPYTVAVNVATRQLDGEAFPKLVAGVLKETGLDPTRLEIEITESGIIQDQNKALLTIKRLKELGCKIAMDDFGTGYSSLSTLQSFPFDKIKIDREFVKDIDGSEETSAILRASIAIANSMNIPVLAEGAETDEHMEVLKSCNCDYVQGFYFGKPLPQDELQAIVRNSESLNANGVDKAA